MAKTPTTLLKYTSKEFRKLSDAKQEKILNKLSKSASLRLNTLSRHNINSIPVQAFNNAGGLYDAAKIANLTTDVGKSSYYSRLKTLLESQTTTLKGYNTWKKNVAEYTGKDVFNDKYEYTHTFWDMVSRAQDSSRNNLQFIDSNGNRRELSNNLWSTLKNYITILPGSENGYASQQAFAYIKEEVTANPEITMEQLISNLLVKLDLNIENISTPIM